MVTADDVYRICFKSQSFLLGFTTGVPTDPDQRRYTEEQVQAMAEVLKKYQFFGKRITYPVRAILVGET